MGSTRAMHLLKFISMAPSKRPGNRWRKDTRIKRWSELRRALKVLGLMLALACIAGGQAPIPSEYQVKAAFLYNFAKFVEWPASSFSSLAAPLQICVFGPNPFGEALREITRDKVVGGRKIAVNDLTDVRQTRNCHILFISAAETVHAKEIFERLRGTSILTVGDTRDFIGQGGMINFVLENERVQFEVNRKTAEQSGLKISSKLLSLARSVVV
jgi:hypothetical protein